MKRVAIIQSNYIPWKGYFDIINCVDEFIILDDVQYTKRDWRNRNKIKTPNGTQWLTIPVQTKNKYKQMIKDVIVSNNSWAQQHYNKIVRYYSKTKYFNEYKDFFADLYFGTCEKDLSSINYKFLSKICMLLGIKTIISWSMRYKSVDGKNERIISLCKQAGADEYLSGTSAKSYLDENMFRTENIKVRWMSYEGYQEYNQLYCPPFIHDVSILDMIFNEGTKGAREHMLSFNKLLRSADG